MPARPAPFVPFARLETADGPLAYAPLAGLARETGTDLTRLPHTVRIVLENILRRYDGRVVTEDHVTALAGWTPSAAGEGEVPFLPMRVVMQDFTGVPAVVDLAAMRSAMARIGGDPQKVNPLAPVDLVIDHSVQVDFAGTPQAFQLNVEREYERNSERYQLLRWAQKAFANFRVVPPGTGIVHQVNLEYLADVVAAREIGGQAMAFPDTLVGTDSHTTMVNGLGVLGWGVGGIEAEAAMLGQPTYLLTPTVVGVVLSGDLKEGVTATDLVLAITQLLRRHGVVGKFVEFAGPGIAGLTLADRATIANMAPEYGATCGFFPVDAETLAYLRMTGRPAAVVDRVERYCRAQGLFLEPGDPVPAFSETLEFDLGSVEPSLAGPRRPQDRVVLSRVQDNFRTAYAHRYEREPSPAQVEGRIQQDDEAPVAPEAPDPEALIRSGDGNLQAMVSLDGVRVPVGDGTVAIAAITSCTNTSNPAVMLAAGLVAKKAVERGLAVPPWVKTSLAPGSQVVTEYLQDAGLIPYLEQLRFHVIGYGCTTCIGNSGPLAEPIADAIHKHDLVVSAVLSGNRNFEGRVHPLVRAAYLASPPLVVAYALAGTVDRDLTTEPIGIGTDGEAVYLKDIWPSNREVQDALDAHVQAGMFSRVYEEVFSGDSAWAGLPVPEGEIYAWDEASTYIQEPPFFKDLGGGPVREADILGARALAVLGDSITTDHISPAGSIPVDSPAGQFLLAAGVTRADFNSYGSRRGNDRVMVRGTFGNVRLRNMLVPDGREGDWTVHVPSGEVMRIFDASQAYQASGTPLIVLGGKEYGSGSSRDWAAKGTLLLGIKAVLAESFERIHRSNLVGMGVLPLLYADDATRESLGLTGQETFSTTGLSAGLTPRMRLTVTATRADGTVTTFPVIAAVDSVVEVDYYRNGGVLPLVLRQMQQDG